MKKFKNIEEYKEILRQVQTEHKNFFSNIYFLACDVQRYIELERAYYIRTKEGFFLILDEEKYYRVCLYVDITSDIQMPVLDKKIVIKNVYRKGREEDAQSSIEKSLEQQGFVKAGSVVQVKGNVSELLEKCKHLEKHVTKMESKGFRCIRADKRYYEEIENLLLASQKIHDYQIDYKTDEEKNEMPIGTYLCILNDKDEICAANVCYIEGEVAYGEGAAVVDRYKMQGLAPIMTYHRLKWLEEKGVPILRAWILEDNTASLRYHTSVGYKFVNKYVNEWIRETEE